MGEGDSQTPFKEGLFSEEDSWIGSGSLTISSYAGGSFWESDSGVKPWNGAKTEMKC